MSEIERELAKELGFSIVQVPMDENNVLRGLTLPLRADGRGMYVGLATENEQTMWRALVSTREQLATLRTENERLKQERDEAHSFADALEVRIETWRGMHKDAIERAETAERERDEARELVERWKYVERTWTERNKSLERLVAALKEALSKLEHRFSLHTDYSGAYVNSEIRDVVDAARAMRGEE